MKGVAGWSGPAVRGVPAGEGGRQGGREGGQRSHLAASHIQPQD